MKYLVFLLIIVLTLILSGCNGFRVESESALNSFSQRAKGENTCKNTGVGIWEERTAELDLRITCKKDSQNVQFKVLNP